MASHLLLVASFLLLGIGLAHSVLGERYIIGRILRQGELPRLFGDDWFTRRTLRFAWHLTTVAWWGLGAVLLVLRNAGPRDPTLGLVADIVGVTFLVHGLVAAIASRGRHLAWIGFLAVAACCLGWSRVG